MMFIPLMKYVGSTGCLPYSSVEGAERYYGPLTMEMLFYFYNALGI